MRKKQKRILFTLVTGFVLLLGGRWAFAACQEADLVILNGKILTANSEDPANFAIVEAAANANEDMIEFLRDTWDGGVKGGTKGLKNIKAQTRIASSYGLLQMTYPLALSRTYPDDVNHLPENLNMTYPIIDLCMVYQKDILKRRLTPAVESANNWPEGYENGFYLLVYPEWNVIGSYPAEVFKKSRSYLPQR